MRLGLLPKAYPLGEQLNLLCRLLGHKLKFAGVSREGRVYECVRENLCLPEAYWPDKFVTRAEIEWLKRYGRF